MGMEANEVESADTPSCSVVVDAAEKGRLETARTRFWEDVDVSSKPLVFNRLGFSGVVQL